jgi:hypothetical protein
MASDSVPPLVNAIRPCGSPPPMAEASLARASSSPALASAPQECLLEGLPKCRAAKRAASARISASGGEVAAQSR